MGGQTGSAEPLLPFQGQWVLWTREVVVSGRSEARHLSSRHGSQLALDFILRGGAGDLGCPSLDVPGTGSCWFISAHFAVPTLDSVHHLVSWGTHSPPLRTVGTGLSKQKGLCQGPQAVPSLLLSHHPAPHGCLGTFHRCCTSQGPGTFSSLLYSSGPVQSPADAILNLFCFKKEYKSLFFWVF